MAAQSGETTHAHAHLAAAADDAQAYPIDIDLPGAIRFGATSVAIRQLEVAITTSDLNRALTIAARLNTADQPTMTRARARMYVASAHGPVGNVSAGARLIAEITDIAPQLINDPVIERLLKPFTEPTPKTAGNSPNFDRKANQRTRKLTEGLPKPHEERRPDDALRQPVLPLRSDGANHTRSVHSDGSLANTTLTYK